MLIEVDTDASGKAEPYTLDQALEGLFVPKEKFVDILQALEVKKNVILLGPPGVGKTFIATRLAYALMQAEDPTRVGFVQFHQSMTYEDLSCRVGAPWKAEDSNARTDCSSSSVGRHRPTQNGRTSSSSTKSIVEI